jgi:hypothetical protein
VYRYLHLLGLFILFARFVVDYLAVQTTPCSRVWTGESSFEIRRARAGRRGPDRDRRQEGGALRHDHQGSEERAPDRLAEQRAALVPLLHATTA